MQKIIKRLLCCLLVSLMVIGCSQQNQTALTGVDFIMNTWVEQRWFGKNNQKALDEIKSELSTFEQGLSMYISDSEIAQLNKMAGKEPVKLSDRTFELLSRSIEFSKQSDGLFDVTIAPLTTLWGITNKEPHIPTTEEIEAAKALIGYDKVVLDYENKTAFLPLEGMSVDLGGVAKGSAADLTREIAIANKVNGFVSIGGNMMVNGKKPDKTDFNIAIRDPRGEASEYIATLSLDGFTMATTGDYERFFEHEGARYHHVLDPFTGYPSQTDLISVTVISKDGALADFLSTAIFMQGSENLHNHLNQQDYSIIAITKDFKVYCSPTLNGVLLENSEKPQYKFFY